MSPKENYIKTEMEKLCQEWSGIVFLVGIILFPMLGIMDYYVVSVDKFHEFFIYRAIATICIAALYFLNKLKSNSLFQYALITIAVTISAVTIELMILSLGGHSSTYYAGLNLVIITVLAFVPVNVFVASISVALVYAIYIIPISLLNTITDERQFITNNAFMLSTMMIALMYRANNQKRLLSELSLQFDLAAEKDKLENYSIHLEKVVVDRTKELVKSEQWHRLLFESARDGIVVIDSASIIVNVNNKACEMHGFPRDALIGSHIKIFDVGGDQGVEAEVIRRVLTGESIVFETIHHKKDGTQLYLEISSQAVTIDGNIFIQSLYRDITERKQMHDHLMQAQKMESLGALTGGLAHDLNNILSVIMGCTFAIRDQAPQDEKVIRSVDLLETVTDKAAQMVSKLLGFARKSTGDMLPLNVNDVVNDTVKLLERALDKNVKMSLQLSETFPSSVKGDFNQIQQVIMNLIVNARDAMPNGGKITLFTTCRKIVKGMQDVPPYIEEGEYVQLKISDTGVGIPDRLKARIFDPFFTTKERGKGTGLGLAMAYGIIKQHAGYINVESKVGIGSTFTIYLPIFRPAVDNQNDQDAIEIKKEA